MSDAEFGVGSRGAVARMQVETTGSARIRHKVTGVVYMIDANELDWEIESTHERDMGPETEWSAVLNHEDLGELLWTFSEYPQGFANELRLVSDGHKVLRNFSVSFEDVNDENSVDFDPEAAAEEMKEWF